MTADCCNSCYVRSAGSRLQASYDRRRPVPGPAREAAGSVQSGVHAQLPSPNGDPQVLVDRQRQQRKWEQLNGACCKHSSSSPHFARLMELHLILKPRILPNL